MAENLICSCGQASEFMCKNCPNLFGFCVVHMVAHLKETSHSVQQIDQVYIQEYLNKLAKTEIQSTIREIIMNTEILISDIISMSNTFIKQLNEMSLYYITSDHLTFIRYQRERMTEISKEARVMIEELKNPKAAEKKFFHHNKNSSSFNHEQPSDYGYYNYPIGSGFSTTGPSSKNEKPTHVPRSYSTVNDYQPSTAIYSESNPPLLPFPPSHSKLSLLNPSNGTYVAAVNTTVPVDSNLSIFQHSSSDSKSTESKNLNHDERNKMKSNAPQKKKKSEEMKTPHLLNKKNISILNAKKTKYSTSNSDKAGDEHPNDSEKQKAKKMHSNNGCFIF